MAVATSQLSKLQVSISSVFTDVTKLTQIPLPSKTVAYEDITTLDSTAMEWYPLLPDVSIITVSGIFDVAVASHLYCRASNTLQTLESWKIIGSDAGTFTAAFSGYVAKFEVSYDVNKVQRFSMDIRVSGAITDTP